MTSLAGSRAAGRSDSGEGDAADVSSRKLGKDRPGLSHGYDGDHFPPVNQLNPNGQHSGSSGNFSGQGEAKKLDRASLIAMGAAALSR